MGSLVYRCPNTGFHVQAWPENENDHTYEIVICTACQRAHFIHTKTGKLLGDEEEAE